jgi:hypothetical protein
MADSERRQLSPLAAEAWNRLGQELDTWAETGQCASFWWRDDDASTAGERLAKMLNLSSQYNIPLALAVIPSRLQPSLPDTLQEHPLVAVLQHGFAHENNAGDGQRKLELGGRRARSDIVADLERGYQILDQSFGARFSPVLVPPWNRIDDQLLSVLPELGFRGISTMRVRRSAYPAPRLLQVNTHLDPINWRHQGCFLGVYPAIAILLQHLRARRTGYRDSAEPTGILTHHLVQNDAVWRFLDELFEFLSLHPAVSWRDSSSIWCQESHNKGITSAS